MTDLLTRIQDARAGMTRSHGAVADYIAAHSNDLVFATLEELAGKIGVSTTTVIRFSRGLGYEGFTDMQNDMRSGLLDRTSLPERMDHVIDTLKQDSLLTDCFQADLDSISKTLNALSPENLARAADAISDAENVYVLGARSAYPAAFCLAGLLKQVRPRVSLVQFTGMAQADEITGARTGDTCVAFLFPHYYRHSQTIESMVRWMKKQGVQIVLITEAPSQSLLELGDIVLSCCTDGIALRHSVASLISLSNYLSLAVALKDDQRTHDTLCLSEEVMQSEDLES